MSDKYNWEDQGGNFILRKKDFNVSYNPETGKGILGIFEMFNPGERKCGDMSETALIVEGNYYILDGDFRKEYEQINSKTEALEFFNNNSQYKSKWSTVDE